MPRGERRAPASCPITGASEVTADIRPTAFRLDLAATDLAVREALGDLRARLAAQGLSEEGCGSVEIALAEALNNIVEHAYPAGQPGEIRLSVTMTRDRLCCRLRDQGAPLPDLAVPARARPDPAAARAALPEGGFGWYLIRDLTDALSYARLDGENILTLEFALAAL